jgi:hypothetical protein
MPHEHFGRLLLRLRCVHREGNNVELYCNECGAVVVRGEENVTAYTARFLGDSTIVAIDCPRCRALNTFPEFETVLAYVCNQCAWASMSLTREALR